MPASPASPASPVAAYAEPADPGPETPLEGGDVTEGLVRIGDTVRRPVTPNSPLIRALLTHLENVGFEGAPRFLGIDAAGRDVMTFIPGEVAGRPRPEWIADESRLRSVGRLIRAYDDATVDFVLPEGVRFDSGFAPVPGAPPVPQYPVEIVGHLDITPENMVFRDGEAYALIDFDFAKPAPRIDELANLMMWWVPFGDPTDMDPRQQNLDIPRRSRILADAYGMSEEDRGRLIEVTTARTRRSWFTMKAAAEEKGGGWARMWDEGVGDVIKRREAWLDGIGAAIEAALLA